MTARRTNNSLAVSLEGKSSPSATPPLTESSVPLLLAAAANLAPQSASTVSAPVIAAVHDPALIAAIADAVKASLAADKDPGSASSNLSTNSASEAKPSASGGVPP